MEMLYIGNKSLEDLLADQKQAKDSLNNEYTLDARVEQLEAENARLRAELDALKPKPVIVTKMMGVQLDLTGSLSMTSRDNLKLTFHDGKLVKAEVLGC